MNIRPATTDDAEAIADIYNHYVQHTTITFETENVTSNAMRQRIAESTSAGYPCLVAVKNNKIAGYCYAHRWDARRAYGLTQEVSIYLHPDHTGNGYGTALLDCLVKSINPNITHCLIAGICTPNDSSVRLHEKFGFKQISHFRQVGRKFGQWLDVGHWQLIIDEKAGQT